MDNRYTGTQHKLRMPPELKEKLFTAAKDMNRSLNAEIVARLEDSFTISNKQPVYLPETNLKELNAILSLSFGSIIKKLIQNGVPVEVVLDSFPNEKVFIEIIDMFKDLNNSKNMKKTEE